MNVSAVLSTVVSYLDVPALVLLLLLFAGWGVVKKAQSRPDFDFAKMLKDDNDKESVTRLGALTAIAVSSWAVMYDTVHSQAADHTVLGIYLVVWSGTKIADKLADAFLAKWSK